MDFEKDLKCPIAWTQVSWAMFEFFKFSDYLHFTYGGKSKIRCSPKFGALFTSRDISRLVTFCCGIFQGKVKLRLLAQNCDKKNELPECKLVKISQKCSFIDFSAIHPAGKIKF